MGDNRRVKVHLVSYRWLISSQYDTGARLSINIFSEAGGGARAI